MSMLIVIHFNPSRSFFYVLYSRDAQTAARGPCGPPQRFQWPAEAFRKFFKCEISSNSSQ